MDASALDKGISALQNQISGIEHGVDKLEKFLWIASVVVAIGVAMELYSLLHEYRADRAAWARGIIAVPGKPSRIVLFIDIIAVLLVVAGVVGELATGILSANKNEQLRGKNRELIRLIEQKLAEQGPRLSFLNGENRKNLIDKLRPFAGQNFTVTYCRKSQNDDEVTQLWVLLSIVLDEEAGWKWDHRFHDINCAGHGVMIQVNDNSSARTKEAAKALHEALLRTGMPGVLGKVYELPAGSNFRLAADPEVVQILVMSHP
jgi:hypothetical protein